MIGESGSALDREASREDDTIGSSPCRSVREERDSLSTRDSAFSVEQIFPPLHHGYNRTSYFIFCRAENLTNGLLPACVFPRRAGKSRCILYVTLYLWRWKKYLHAHLSHRSKSVYAVYATRAIRVERSRNKKAE